MSIPLSQLERAAAGRTVSLFAADMASRAKDLTAGIRGRAVLVVGGAGSIGSATVRLLAEYAPGRLHVVDQDENGLVEVLRDLRSSGVADGVGEIRPVALDYGSPLMARFLRAGPGYDLVLNLAAIKHVRSERDLPSILHMLDTNVVKPQRLIESLAANGFKGGYYAVSTDKAADPVNYMGASKRLQEILTLESDALAGNGARPTCARFANVAFSNGSLLYGFVRRLERNQALAVPRRITRYLITHEEAAQICLLAAVCGPAGHTMVPRLEGNLEPIELKSVAEAFLHEQGLRPVYCETEKEARDRASHTERGTYPVLLTEPDTTGEKMDEKFVGDSERTVDIGMKNLLGVKPPSAGITRAVDVVRGIESLIVGVDRPADATQVETLMKSVLVNFKHAASEKRLDDRM